MDGLPPRPDPSGPALQLRPLRCAWETLPSSKLSHQITFVELSLKSLLE